MPQLILVRHGNTFESGETPRRVGAKTDMKLTAKGEEQGRAIAESIVAQYHPFGGILAGPLVRTRRFAEILAAKANTGFTVDERLIELDYGLWENKTDDEIKSAYGAEMLEAWDKDGVWPEGMNWAPSKDKLEHNLHAFLDEQHKKLIAPQGALSRVAITSNGILRFIYRFITGQNPDSAAKVKTGAYCVLTPKAEGWDITAWNVKP